jgi:hypothetical protein
LSKNIKNKLKMYKELIRWRKEYFQLEEG